MATTNTGLVLISHLINRGGLGLVLENGEIGALAAGSITSVVWLRRDDYANNTFRNLTGLWWRPENATGIADDVRAVGDLTKGTGVLANDASWADTTLGTEDVYLLYHGIHPLWLIEAMNRALRRIYFQNLEPLCIKPTGTTLADAGFQNSATTHWTESDADGGAATTFTKISTTNSENVFRGLRSGRVLNAAAGGYIRKRFPVTPGDQVVVHVLTRLDAGTNSELVLYDLTNSAAIGTTVEHSQEAWQYIRRIETIPAGCKTLEVRIQGEGASDDVYVNGLWVMPQNSGRIVLDTMWEAKEHSIPSLAYVKLEGISIAGDVYDAHSARLIEIPDSAYSFDPEPPGANPLAVQFHDKSYLQYPIYIQGRRAHSDVDGPFTRAMTEATSIDLDLFVWMALEELWLDDRVHVPDKRERLAKAQTFVEKLSPQVAIAGPAETRQAFWYPSLRN